MRFIVAPLRRVCQKKVVAAFSSNRESVQSRCDELNRQNHRSIWLWHTVKHWITAYNPDSHCLCIVDTEVQ